MYPAAVLDLDRLDALFGGVSITYALIALNIGVSLIGFWALRKKKYRPYFVFVPSKSARSRHPAGAVLSHFAHGDVGHLIVNLLALFLFGPRVERALGPAAYLIVYVASGIAGTLLVYVFRRKDPQYAALGASGAIAGVVFASVVIAPTSRIFLLVFPVPVPAPVFALLYLILSSVQMGGRDGVAHEAHIGGALAGFGLAGLLYGPGFAPLVRVVEGLLG